MSSSAFELEVDREGLEYAVGDCTLLIRNGVDARPYSLSSHPDEPTLRFLVRRLGPAEIQRSFSHWLGSLETGNDVGVGTPFGKFHPGQGPREVWLAGGTGLSPFLSALRGARPQAPLVLAVGVRSPEEALWPGWLDQRAPVVWAFSRRAPHGLEPKRLTQVATEVPVAPDIRYYLCGGRSLVQEVSNILLDRGVDARQIHEELFFS